MTSIKKPITFFIVLEHARSDEVKSDLLNYLDTSDEWLISLETAKSTHQHKEGQHFHILCTMSDSIYDTYRKTILVRKYKLSGKVTNGIGREYGKSLAIRDLERLFTYLVKDGNIITNIEDESRLERYKELSFKRIEKKELFDDVITMLKESHQDALTPSESYTQGFGIENEMVYDPYIAGDLLFTWMRAQFNHPTRPVRKAVTASQLRSFITCYMMYHSTIPNYIILQFINFRG